jgi:hypothetical protein
MSCLVRFAWLLRLCCCLTCCSAAGAKLRVKRLLLLAARPLAAQLVQLCCLWGLLLLGLTAAGAAPLLNGCRCAQLRMLLNFAVCMVGVLIDA